MKRVMNDPHVAELIYRIEKSDFLEFKESPLLDIDFPDFTPSLLMAERVESDKFTGSLLSLIFSPSFEVRTASRTLRTLDF